MAEAVHRTAAELHAGLATIRQSPRHDGRLDAIVIRPVSNQREMLERCFISAAGGVHGDRWANGCWRTLPDGSPHPDVQVCIANSRAMDVLTNGNRELWPPAGDNLFVDFDLSRSSLYAGQQLAIGTAVIEITEQAHLGCRMFAQRYGAEAVAWVNSAEGQQLRLRGIYAKVVHDGEVAVGDVIRRV